MIIYSVYCDDCGKPIVTDAESKASALFSVRTQDYITPDKRQLCAQCAEKAGYLVKCPGEAHKNSYIERCGVCAPRWGVVEVK